MQKFHPEFKWNVLFLKICEEGSLKIFPKFSDSILYGDDKICIPNYYCLMQFLSAKEPTVILGKFS